MSTQATSSTETETTTDERPTFKLERYNPRRRSRGAEAAELSIKYSDGSEDLIWMSQNDIAANIAEFGPCEGLNAALNAYRDNVEFPAR